MDSEKPRVCLRCNTLIPIGDDICPSCGSSQYGKKE